MNNGYFSLIRCVPDPARGEAFNVGVLIWLGNEYRFAVDPTAVKRAAKENPLLARDALVGLESAINSQIRKLGEFSHEKFDKLRMNQPGIPFLFAEPSYVRIPESGIDILGDAMERLLDRIVRPRQIQEVVTRRADALQDALWALISAGQVIPSHSLTGGITQRQRPVDYFANHGSGIALDVLHLEKKRSETIETQADAEAFKIYDLLRGKLLKKFFVYCTFSHKESKQRANTVAANTIQSAGGEVVRTTKEAVLALRAVG